MSPYCEDDLVTLHMAQAWQEGWEAGCNDQQYGDENAEPWSPNPYRKACVAATGQMNEKARYVVGYFCHKGSGHFEMYHDPEAEMACGGSLVPLYMDAEDADWLRKYDLLPEGQWEVTAPPGQGASCSE